MKVTTTALKAALKKGSEYAYWVFDEKLGKTIIGTRQFFMALDREQVSSDGNLRKTLASFGLFQEGSVVRNGHTSTDPNALPNFSNIAQPVFDSTYGEWAEKTKIQYKLGNTTTLRLFKTRTQYFVVNEVYADLIGDLEAIRYGGKCRPVVTEGLLILPYSCLPAELEEMLAPIKEEAAHA